MRKEAETSFRHARIAILRERLAEIQFESATASTPHEASKRGLEIFSVIAEIEALEKQNASEE